MGLFVVSNHSRAIAFSMISTMLSSSFSVLQSGPAQPFTFSLRPGPPFGSCPLASSSSSPSSPGSGSPARCIVGGGIRPPPFSPSCSEVGFDRFLRTTSVLHTGSALLLITIVGATDL